MTLIAYQYNSGKNRDHSFYHEPDNWGAESFKFCLRNEAEKWKNYNVSRNELPQDCLKVFETAYATANTFYKEKSEKALEKSLAERKLEKLQIQRAIDSFFDRS